MALGRQRERQSDILVSWAELPRSPGHAFYDKLQTVLIASDFDRFVEMQCASEYAPRHGRPSLPPGRYFRMLLVGYFERGAKASQRAAECRELAAKESEPESRARLQELAAQYDQDARRWSGEDRSPFMGRGGGHWLRKYR